jgi:uncharacterized integral membrane protein (TIGR00698 family)
MPAGSPRPTAPPPTPAPAAAAALSRALLALGAAFCLVPWSRVLPALDRFHIEIGLALGIILALAGLVHPGSAGKKVSRIVIQVCVVLLGFRMDLREVVHDGGKGLLFAAGTIITTFALGWAIGERALRIDGKLTTLVSSGTAICGGSAIAAVSTVIGASSAQISVATATVFILNGIALYLFPPLGHALGLTPQQFGAWAGVAIHDISSVVGAAQSFDSSSAPGSHSVDTATIVKLSRVLWIVPICIVAARWPKLGGAGVPPADSGATDQQPRRTKLPIPWFIALFLLAAAVRSLWPEQLSPAAPVIGLLAKSGMALALFLIGAGLSRKALAEVGWRPMALGVSLWLFIACASLAIVRAT